METISVSLTINGVTFEAACIKNTVQAFRDGKLAYNKCLASDEIFTDVAKGTRASAADIANAFPTMETREILTEIVMKGRYSMTTSERKAVCDSRLNEIIGHIAENYTNSATGILISKDAITTYLSGVKGFKVDPERSAIAQIPEVLKILQRDFILEKSQPVLMRVGVPNEYVGQFQGGLKRFGKPQNEIWTRAGLVVDIQISKKELDNFYQFAEASCAGHAKVAVLEGEGMVSTQKEVSLAGRNTYKQHGAKRK